MTLWNWSGHVTADLLPLDEGLLTSARAAEVERHVQRCPRCGQQLESIRRARQTLRTGLAPQRMPDQVSDTVRHGIVSGSRGFPISDFRSPISDFRFPISDSRFPIQRSAIAAIVLLLVAGAGWQVSRPWIGLRDSSTPPLAFERAARALHEQAAQGGLSLDFESSSPAAIREWLHDRGAPVAKLVQQPGDNPARIVPVGASVAKLRGGSASLVRYEIDGHPVTLMTADAAATAGPSSSWPLSKQITHRRDGGLDALTWTTSGQTYVLVSNLPGRGTQACLLCHVDPRFRQAVSRF
jgi:anti-sigma factor RsiW